MDKIIIKGLRCMARVGVPGRERAAAQKVVIDIEMESDLATACRRDDIRSTTDYKRVADRVRKRLASRKFRLLESLTEDVCRMVLDQPRVLRTRVRAKKYPSSMAHQADWVAVELVRESEPPGA